MVGAGMLILYLGISAVSEALRVISMNILGFPWKEHKRAQLICSALNLIWAGLSVLKLVPMYAAFAVYMFIWYLPIICAKKEQDALKVFSIMGFQQFAAVYLIYLGIISAGRSSLSVMNSQFLVKTTGYLVSKVMLCFFCLIWIRLFAEKSGTGDRHDQKKSKMFMMFLRSCLGYVYLDSFLGSFFSDQIFIPILLISGNVLILILTTLFMRHNYLLSKDQHIEEEYQKMEEEKARTYLRQERMVSMARTDGLTGAWTRGYGMFLLESLKKEHAFFSVAYMDLDGLKQINDSRGHDAGDCYLKMFVDGIKRNLTKGDLLVRIGGDEFLAVFINRGSEEAVRKLEESRKVMEEGNLPVSFSFGVASGRDTIKELMEDADHAMYLDKKCRKGKG